MVDVFVDRSVPKQVYVEDCYVCCRPILLSVRIGVDDEVLGAERGDGGRFEVGACHQHDQPTGEEESTCGGDVTC